MNRKFRLTSSLDIQRVRRQGKSYAHPLLVLVALENQLDQTRFAVSAGVSVGNAVQRNRAKRLIRAGLQDYLEKVKKGYDILLIARKPLADAASPDAAAALEAMLRKADLLST